MRWTLLLTTATLFLTAACGPQAGSAPGSPPPGGSTAGPRSTPANGRPRCPLDASTIGAALGLTMAAATDASCGLRAADAPQGTSVEVVYTLVDPQMYQYSDGDAVSGVGDGARWEHVGPDLLIVKHQDWYFSIQSLVLGNPPGLDPKDVAVTVAKLVLRTA